MGIVLDDFVCELAERKQRLVDRPEHEFLRPCEGLRRRQADHDQVISCGHEGHNLDLIQGGRRVPQLFRIDIHARALLHYGR